MKYLFGFAVALFPMLSHAQSGSLQQLIIGIGGFINEIVIPFTLGVAFLIFLINAVRYFVIGGSSTEGQENARNVALYGIGAFVLILSLWGMTNLLVNGFGLGEDNCIDGRTIQSDYIDSAAPCSTVRPQSRPTRPAPTNVPFEPAPFGPQ